MSRRRRAEKREILPDPKFKDLVVSKFMNNLMLDGKKSVSEKIVIEKSIGIGIGKNLVSKKVSDSVSKKIGIGKKFRIRFRSDFGFRHTPHPRLTSTPFHCFVYMTRFKTRYQKINLLCAVVFV